jgi:hypothetical protein
MKIRTFEKVVYHAAWKKKQPVMKAKYYFPDFLNNPSQDHSFSIIKRLLGFI